MNSFIIPLLNRGKFQKKIVNRGRNPGQKHPFFLTILNNRKRCHAAIEAVIPSVHERNLGGDQLCALQNF